MANWIKIKFGVKGFAWYVSLIAVVLINKGVFSQSTSYNQFMHDLQFTRPVKDKLITELNFAFVTTSTGINKNPVSKFSQLTPRMWFHYYLGDKWKLSLFANYYKNFEIKEIGQIQNQEWRFAPQGIYSLFKERFKLTTRMRFEVRMIETANRVYNDFYRYRQQIKFLQPINSANTDNTSWYFYTMDEVFFNVFNKSGESVSFDRNRLTFGFGKTFTDNFQLELAYVNEYLPRSFSDQIYHSISLSFIFNNLYGQISDKLNHPKLDVKSDE